MSTKAHSLAILLLAFFFASNAFAQLNTNFNADSTFFRARKLAFEGKRDMARDSLLKILTAYPDYLDVELLLAKTYSWDQQFDEARDLFNRMTSAVKDNRELWLATIKNEVYAKRYNLVLGLANKALRYFPDDAEIKSLKKMASKNVQGEYDIYEVLKKENNSKAVKNNISVSSEVQLFDNYFQPFYKNTIQYQRNTAYGSILPRVNYVDRFGLEGTQFELDVYPKLSRKLHGYFNYGYSDAAIMPKHRLGAELYLQLPLAMETSLGFRHLAFEGQKVSIFTGSYGLYTSNYYLSVRPFVSYSDGDMGFSGSVLARKYLKNAQNYLSANLTYGVNAESNQFFNEGVLLAESLTYLSAIELKLAYQFTDKSNLGAFQTSLNFSRQEVPFSPNDFVHSASIGLQYRFNF